MRRKQEAIPPAVGAASRGREPYAEVRRCGPLGGVEIWSFFNWMRPGSYCSPEVTLTTPASRAISRIQARRAGRPQVGDASCVLVTGPEEVVVVQRLEGSQPSQGERTIVGVTIPAHLLPAAQREQPRAGLVRSRDGVDVGDELRRLIAVLEADDAPLCYREELIGELVERLARDPDTTAEPRSRPCTRTVERCLEYIHAHYVQPFSLESLACAVGVTKWHLTRTFNKQLGLTPGEYTRVLKVQRALCLVRSGVAPRLAAAQTGYSDQSHMTREVRAVGGITPGSYGLRVRRLPTD